MIITVFTGIDRATEGLPLVFETLVIDPELSVSTRYYTTWRQAEAGHRQICADIDAATTEQTR